MTDEVECVNWLGKLNELGAKCRFLPIIDVTDAQGSSVGAPRFKATIHIPEHSILIEHIAANKKSAKSSAARAAYQKICEKLNEPHTASLNKLIFKLKELSVQDNEMTRAANFFKDISKLGATKITEDMASYSELCDIADELQCDLSYNHDELKTENSTEFRFRCEIRPKGFIYPVIIGFGSSLSNANEARTIAVKQLVSLLRVYSCNNK